MTHCSPRLLCLLLPFVADGRATVWQFSTAVKRLPLADLRRGALVATHGTSIDCVLDHLLAHPAVRTAVVVTDGIVGPARLDLRRRIAERGLRIQGVLPAGGWRPDLDALGAKVTVLPPLGPSRRR
jgi:hypothetical protein